MKKWLALGVKVAVSAGLIWLLFRDVDLDAALRRVATAETLPLALGIAVILVQVLVVAWRWRLVLTGIGASLPFGQVFRFFYISAFFNQALPASVGGDAVRVYKAYKAGLSLGAAFNSAMLDRVAALVAVVVMMGATLPLLFQRIDDPSARLGLGVMVALALTAVALLMVLDRLPSGLYRWRMLNALAVLAGDARRTFLSLAHTPWVLAASILGHVMLSVGVWALAMSLGISVGVIDCILLFPPVILISSLPVSIAGWGVREGAMVAAFGFVGVAPDAALVLSILFGLSLIAVNLPGGVIWLTGGGRLPDSESLRNSES